jgi:transposase
MNESSDCLSINTIALDVHSSFCQGGWVDRRGQERAEWQVPTSLPALREAIGRVPRPRRLVMEEGPLADWLGRDLSAWADELIICDPHRNALIAKDDQKSDAIDWRKLASLSRGGFLRAVHHSGELSRSTFKRRVLLYHERVAHRVSEGNKLIWRVRQLGVVIKHRELEEGVDRQAVLKAMEIDERAREDVQLLLAGYDQACRQVTILRRQIEQAGREQEVIRRLQQLPGVGWIRAATFYAIVDTPYRFASRQKLWKYAGIGLERKQSGTQKARWRVVRRCNRPLKNVILGAAKSAAASKDNYFADQYQRWLDEGCSPRIARRNLARSLASVMWGMWKSGSDYDQQKLRSGMTMV